MVTRADSRPGVYLPGAAQAIYQTLNICDQFAFRPTGSTTAAIVAMLFTVRSLLADNDFVHVFAFDFSKAFDTVRHVTLAGKLAHLELPGSIYNWAVGFLHCTKYARLVSAVAVIRTSVIQGSALGPASYIVTAADLHPVYGSNKIFKFADDTYPVVPGSATCTCKDEIAHLQTWAAGSNLRLNREKTKEIIFSARRKGALPPPLSGIERVPSLRVLGVTVNDKLTAADHMATLLLSSTSLLYAMRVVRSHGTPPSSLHDIFCSTVVSRIQYVAPLWSGMCSAADRTRLDSLLRRSKRLGYCSDNVPVVADLFNTADDDFSIASEPTLTAFSSRIFLTRLTFRISSVIALTTLHK